MAIIGLVNNASNPNNTGIPDADLRYIQTLTSASGNVIQPTSDTSALTLRAYSGQSSLNPLFQVTDSGGTNVHLKISYNSTDGIRVGIGNFSIVTTPKLTVVDTAADDSTPRGMMSLQISADTYGGRIGLGKARGTTSVPLIVATGDTLGRLMFRGFDGSTFLAMGSIEVVATGTVGSTRVPTYMSFYTGKDNVTSSVLTEWMRLYSDGGLQLDGTFGTSPGQGGLKMSGNLTTGGARILGNRSVVTTGTGTPTVGTTSDHVVIFTGTATQIYTLPACSAGRELYIKTKSSGDITINAGGGNTIEGGSTMTLFGGSNACVHLMGDTAGTDWLQL